MSETTLAGVGAELGDVAEFLRGSPPFAELDIAQLSDAVSALRVAYHRRGEHFDRDSELSGLRIIRRGAVDLRDGDAKLLDRLGEGDSFHLGGLNRGPTQVVAQVIEDALIYRLPDDAYRGLRQANRAFDRHFSGQRSRRLRRAARFQVPPSAMLAPVGTVMSRDLLTVPPDRSVHEVARAMADRRVSSAFVVDAAGGLMGIVTDRDLRTRVLAQARDIGVPVGEVMTADPEVISADDTLFTTTLRMTQGGFHHLPVTENGRLAGIVTTSDLILARRDDPVYLVQHISRQTDVDALAAVVAGTPDLVVHWMHSGMSAQQVSQILTAISDAITTRLIDLAQSDLGPAPGPWAWLGFGSQARAEQLLGADQDNGIVIDDSLAEDSLDYFHTLARRVCDGLAVCGYAYCPGEIMATTDTCCQRLSVWKRAVRSWTQEPTQDAVMRISIFFDLRKVHGDESLVGALQSEMLEQAGRNTIFQAALAANALAGSPPLGLFRRFVVDRDGEHRDRFDIKKRGVLLLTDIVRLHALARGVLPVNTEARLQALARDGHMAMVDSRNLTDALHVLQRFRMQHQCRQVRAGQAPDNRIDPRTLSRLDREHLRDAFTIIDEAQEAIRLTYRAGLG